jgi:hypothetical protein
MHGLGRGSGRRSRSGIDEPQVGLSLASFCSLAVLGIFLQSCSVKGSSRFWDVDISEADMIASQSSKLLEIGGA